MSAYTPAHKTTEPMNDDDRRILMMKAPVGKEEDFIRWCELTIVGWQIVQDLLDPEGGAFEVVDLEKSTMDNPVFRMTEVPE